jgi:glutaminyl-tRNA synthetase
MPPPSAPPGNFLRTLIESHLASGELNRATADPARIRTRFPPEPNGYLHIGHAKSICLNFGLARDYGGRCHMRFDDTNPVKEDQEYVDSILDAVQWLGYSWHAGNEDNLYYASDYFERFYQIAEAPFRNRSVDENLRLFREMRAGQHPEGSHVLRARIDMASPNLNLRDPALYRIRFAEHHRTGSTWCIYPMYDYAHPLSDALERITHSICTLEFESHRPLYDWLLERAAECGFFERPLPRQIEFARLNLTYTITSKRKLQELVQTGRVGGWDDPRMPTIVGLRRRGYTPASIQLFCERIGVSKADSWIDMGVLEQSLRDDLEAQAPRATAVLDPVRLVLRNFPADAAEPCTAPVHPQHPELGNRAFSLTRELWIEREDFTESPPKGFFRLFPGNRVRLRYGFVIECTGCDKDADGNVTTVYADYFPDSKSGTPGADTYKVKGNIHWVSAAEALEAEVRLYDRLFTEAHPDAGGRDYLSALNAGSCRVVRARLEPGLRTAAPDQRYQFERHGYFVADRVDSRPGAPVFNRSVTLKDSWGGAPKR